MNETGRIPQFESALSIFMSGTSDVDLLRAALEKTLAGLECAEQVLAQLDDERERLLLSRASVDEITTHDSKLDRARIVLERFDALGEALTSKIQTVEGTNFRSGLARVAAAGREKR